MAGGRRTTRTEGGHRGDGWEGRGSRGRSADLAMVPPRRPAQNPLPKAGGGLRDVSARDTGHACWRGRLRSGPPSVRCGCPGAERIDDSANENTARRIGRKRGASFHAEGAPLSSLHDVASSLVRGSFASLAYRPLFAPQTPAGQPLQAVRVGSGSSPARVGTQTRNWHFGPMGRRRRGRGRETD